LRLGWRGLKIKTTAGYYLRTMQKQEELLRDSNFVVLTETLSTNYPGQRFTPDLIKAVSSDPSFVKVVDFADSQGRHTYLFERVANNR
jgi:hypothetical protein